MPTLTLPTTPATTLAAVALAALYLRLAFGVIRLRRRHQIRLGTGGHADLEAAVRAHANFAEYVPLALVLLLLAEVNHAAWPLTAIAAALLVYGRVTHAAALQRDDIPRRVTGMKATFGAIALAATASLTTFVRW